jgi:predicted permease
MRWDAVFRLRVRSLFRRSAVESELVEELRYHLEREMDRNAAAGMTPEEARFAALRAMGATEQSKEECRDMRGLNWIDNATQDFRYTLRQLRTNPLFAGTAVLVLALGVAAAAAIFGFVDAALIQPLPYRNPSRLVSVFAGTPQDSQGNVSYRDYLEWKRSNTVFSSMDAYGGGGGWGYTLDTRQGAQHVPGLHVTDGFFGTLGVAPMLGRAFYPGEGRSGAPATVLLSYGCWQRRFGGRPDILGKTVRLDGVVTTIVGILPRGFSFAPAGPAEFWTILQPGPCERSGTCSSVFTVARLKDGFSAHTALGNMKAVARQLQREYPDSHRDRTANIVGLRRVIVGNTLPILMTLLAASGLLLTIALINVVSLLLSRSESRGREFAVRNALGASAGRLFTQFAMEALVLAVAGGGLGLLLAAASMRLLIRLIPAGMMAGMPFLKGVGLNAHVALFGAVAGLVAMALFAMPPAMRLRRMRMSDGLKEGSRGSAGTVWRRFGRGLVVAELAIAVTLLVSAGLLGKSLYRLLQVNIGFNATRLATLQVDPPTGYSGDAQWIGLERSVVARISGVPGVESVGASDQLPLGYGWAGAEMDVTGQPSFEQRTPANLLRVSPGYLRTLQAHWLRGRDFTNADRASGRPVAIVNETFANDYFPGQSPIGRQISFHGVPQTAMEIVGMIGDIKEGTLDAPRRPAVYVPFDQEPNDSFVLAVRVQGSADGMFPSLEAAIHSVRPGISVHGEATMRALLDDSWAANLRRSSGWLVGSFAAISFLLGVFGLYGVVAYSVSQRTREIGVRMALGAEPASVRRLIVGESARLIAAGSAIGIAGSIAAAEIMRGLLYGVGPLDPPTIGAATIVLGAAALFAAYVPARRAAAVNPVVALRCE